MKIGLDIDDTLTNTKENQIIYWQEYYNKNPNPNYPSKTLPTNINEFGDNYIQGFWDTYRDILSFNSTYKENTDTTIKKLQNEGYEICIITSRPSSKYNNLKEKIKEELNKNNIYIDEIITDATIKGEHLEENNIDILVDDGIKHINSAIEHNKVGILFNTNPNFSGLQTTNWLELYNIIKSIKK